MTNEEKAIEIAIEFANENIHPAIRIAAEEMGEWKDKEFKEYLEKKRDMYEDNQIGYILYDEIINELFREEEIDQSNNDE